MLDGDAGDDTLRAGAAGSALRGGEGNDTLQGDQAADELDGGRGTITRSGTFELDCVPGRRSYRLTVKTAYLGATVGSANGIGGVGVLCNQDGMWRHRAWLDAQGAGGSTTRALERRLGAKPAGYSAHHIIPALESAENRKDGDVPQGRGYACRIRPNSALNGVYVPGSVHRRMHTRGYYRYVSSQLGAALTNRNGACDQRAAVTIMDRMRAEIQRLARDGRFPTR